jgi:hypothetical protein
MLMKIQSIFLTLLITAFGAQGAFATASTHIWAPSTDVQSYRVWHITSDLYLPVENDTQGNRLPSVTNLGLTVGVLPFQKLNGEIGFDHKSGLGRADDYPFYINLKIGVPENAWNNISPAIAFGAYDIGFKQDLTDYNIFYGKLAKSITTGETSLGRISLGYFSGNKNLLLDNNGQKDNSGILAAWERTFPELSDKLWICVEYMGTKSAYGSMNLGASWKFAPNVSLLGGYDIYNDTNLIDTATLQVDIDF